MYVEARGLNCNQFTLSCPFRGEAGSLRCLAQIIARELERVGFRSSCLEEAESFPARIHRQSGPGQPQVVPKIIIQGAAHF